MTGPLDALAAAGQALWLDDLDRRLLAGDLERLITQAGVRGLTSNPAIFERAIAGGAAYDNDIATRLRAADASPAELYEYLAVADIQRAADQFRPLWTRLGGSDGFVSLEVSPYLADNLEATLTEARRLWRAVDRPNLMVKIPGTSAGLEATARLVGEGINVNVTLIFSVEAYEAAARAHLSGLAHFAAKGGEPRQVNGVASFFVSRLDAIIDPLIDARLASASGEMAADLRGLRGKLAIANAKVAYKAYLDLVSSPRWQALSGTGARPQRLLWASVGAKDPAYSDLYYVEALIGRDTVTTAPRATLEAFREHGQVAQTLSEGLDDARSQRARAARLGLDLQSAAERLVQDGVERFSAAFDGLLGAVAQKRAIGLGVGLNSQRIHPGDLGPSLSRLETRMRQGGWPRRLWAKDASLWPGETAGDWLGWLEASTGAYVDLGGLAALRDEVRARGFRQALLLGMGGSSLGPEVLAGAIGSKPGFPDLLVLDSTDPAQVVRVAGEIDPTGTLFIVASKSGSTLEPDILHQYFFDLVEKSLGPGKAGDRFIAITDPGSKLELTARSQAFWRIFPGEPAIGGRFSVMSNFGMVPAAVMGLDVGAIFAASKAMVLACGPSAPPPSNPGFALGALLGAAAAAKRDKVTLILSEPISALGAWLEQLIAESTGKQGKALIPIDREPLGPPDTYGPDRLFVRIKLEGQAEPDVDLKIQTLAASGHPVASISLASPDLIFQEFIRWEVAIAVTGAVMEVDPFDQPDVESSKARTRSLTEGFERTGSLSGPPAAAHESGLSLFGADSYLRRLCGLAPDDSLKGIVKAHFGLAGPGDYIALLAYVDRTAAHERRLRALAEMIRRGTGIVTLVQFGPRFLHSTGQAYKGGPNSGVFLQLTVSGQPRVPIPGRRLDFETVAAAQAQGDFDVLVERDRRALRIDLGRDVPGGLARLDAIIGENLCEAPE